MQSFWQSTQLFSTFWQNVTAFIRDEMKKEAPQKSRSRGQKKKNETLINISSEVFQYITKIVTLIANNGAESIEPQYTSDVWVKVHPNYNQTIFQDLHSINIFMLQFYCIRYAVFYSYEILSSKLVQCEFHSISQAPLHYESSDVGLIFSHVFWWNISCKISSQI